MRAKIQQPDFYNLICCSEFLLSSLLTPIITSIIHIYIYSIYVEGGPKLGGQYAE